MDKTYIHMYLYISKVSEDGLSLPSDKSIQPYLCIVLSITCQGRPNFLEESNSGYL